MDKIENYRRVIQDILNRHQALVSQQRDPSVEDSFVFDQQRGHYLWLRFGWQHGKRIRAITVYVRLREGKFWIEEDWTENGIATELIKAGVPAQDIVLAFHSPEARPYADLAAV